MDSCWGSPQTRSRLPGWLGGVMGFTPLKPRTMEHFLQFQQRQSPEHIIRNMPAETLLHIYARGLWEGPAGLRCLPPPSQVRRAAGLCPSCPPPTVAHLPGAAEQTQTQQNSVLSTQQASSGHFHPSLQPQHRTHWNGLGGDSRDTGLGGGARTGQALSRTTTHLPCTSPGLLGRWHRSPEPGLGRELKSPVSHRGLALRASL